MGLQRSGIYSHKRCLREQQKKHRQKAWAVNAESEHRERLSSPCADKPEVVPFP